MKSNSPVDITDDEYRFLTEHISDIVVRVDGNLKPTYINPAGVQILGYTLDDFKNGSVLDPVVPEDREELKRFLHTALENHEEHLRHTHRVCAKNGDIRWLETHARLFYDSHGNFLGGTYTDRDVTGHKKAGQALAESEQLYRGLIEASPDGILQTDMRGNITFCNDTELRMFRVSSRNELIGRNALDFVVPEQRKEAGRIIDETLRRGFVEKTPFTALRPEGSLFDIELSASVIHDRDNNPVGFVAIIHDITRRRQNERKNAERRKYLEAILETTPNAILTLDIDNTVREWNRGAEQLFQYTKEEALGRNLDELVCGGDPAVFKEAASYTHFVSRGGSLPPIRTIRYTKKGSAVHVLVGGTPIMIQGEVAGTVASYTDIGDLVEREDHINELLGEKETLLKEVHHRIKNHMAVISGIITLKVENSGKEAAAALGDINHRISLMQDIYQTLYLRKDVTNLLLTDFIENPLNNIEQAYTIGKLISIERNIENLEVSARQSLPVGIIITELVTNALKYAFDGTSEGVIHVSVYTEDTQLMLEVMNNGTGIPEDIIRDKKYGFGLTLVESYARQFGGDLIFSEGGTKASVSLYMES